MVQLLLIWSWFVLLTFCCVYLAWKRNRPALTSVLTLWLLCMCGILWTLMLGQVHRDRHNRIEEIKQAQGVEDSERVDATSEPELGID